MKAKKAELFSGPVISPRLAWDALVVAVEPESSHMMKRMSSTWQLQEAKSRLSEVVRSAQTRGPQTITRHGRPVTVVLSAEAYAQLQPRRKIVEVLRECPEPGLFAARHVPRYRVETQTDVGFSPPAWGCPDGAGGDLQRH